MSLIIQTTKKMETYTCYAEKTDGEIVTEDFRTANIFKNAGIDFCYGGKKKFEDDLHVHVHLENNILYPKAMAL